MDVTHVADGSRSGQLSLTEAAGGRAQSEGLVGVDLWPSFKESTPMEVDRVFFVSTETPPFPLHFLWLDWP